MAAEAPEKSDVSITSPVKLAHVVFRTSRFHEMIDWYKLVLNARPAFESEEIAFLAYDDEHHRVAFIHVPGLADAPAGICGTHHIAFTFADFQVLLQNYERLKARGIEPAWPVNHGPTTSLYYADPDGNQLEFQIDNFDTVEEAGKFFFTDAFAVNSIGVDIDPEDLHRRLKDGVDESELKRRPASGPRGVETIPLR